MVTVTVLMRQSLCVTTGVMLAISSASAASCCLASRRRLGCACGRRGLGGSRCGQQYGAGRGTGGRRRSASIGVLRRRGRRGRRGGRGGGGARVFCGGFGP